MTTVSGSQTPLLVLAVDAATPSLLLRWARDGTLPNLGALVRRGVVGRSRGVEGFFVGSTWPTFYTGLDPSEHGLHYLVQLTPGSYEYHDRADAGLVAREPFWAHLDRAGRSVALLDVPLSPPARLANGVQVLEWGGHDAVFGFSTSPPELGPTLLSRFGEHPQRGPCDEITRTSDGYRSFVDTLVEGVRRRGELTDHFLEEADRDLLLQVFTEAHCVGHQCWHLHDPEHPSHEPEVAAELGDPVRRVYEAIDAEIGRLVERAGERRVFVVVPHGMGHWHGAQFLLPRVLFRLGVARPPGRDRSLRAALGRRIPWRLRAAASRIADLLPGGDVGSRSLPSLGVDPGRSLCFPQLNGLAVGGVRLNLRGREPRGILRPGAEAEAFSERLVEDLLRIVDDRTGRPAVRQVLRTADLYEGEHLRALPDLLVMWDDERAVGNAHVRDGRGARVRLRSPEIGVVEGVNRYGRTGEHRPDGLYVAAGPGLPEGVAGPTVQLRDLAPTFAHLLGAPLPEASGTPVPELAVAP